MTDVCGSNDLVQFRLIQRLQKELFDIHLGSHQTLSRSGTELLNDHFALFCQGLWQQCCRPMR